MFKLPIYVLRKLTIVQGYLKYKVGRTQCQMINFIRMGQPFLTPKVPDAKTGQCGHFHRQIYLSICSRHGNELKLLCKRKHLSNFTDSKCRQLMRSKVQFKLANSLHKITTLRKYFDGRQSVSSKIQYYLLIVENLIQQ